MSSVSSEIIMSLPLLSVNIFNYNLITKIKPFLPFWYNTNLWVVCYSFQVLQNSIY